MSLKLHLLAAFLVATTLAVLIYLQTKSAHENYVQTIISKANQAEYARPKAEDFVARNDRRARMAEDKAKAQNRPEEPDEPADQVKYVAEEKTEPEKPANPVEQVAEAKTELEKPANPVEQVAEAKTEPEKPVEPQIAETKPAEPAEPVKKVFFAEDNIVKNPAFAFGQIGWNYWQMTSEEGAQLVSMENGTLKIMGQEGRLMGLAQGVKLVAGEIYRLGFSVKSLNFDPGKKTFLGARLALNIPGNGEPQAVCLYEGADWQTSQTVFTNRYDGMATLFVHTGYTKNKAECLVKDVELLPMRDISFDVVRSSNGDFSEGLEKGWSPWQISADKVKEYMSVASDSAGTYARIDNKDGSLMGLSEAVNLVSGKVYRIYGLARTENYEPGKPFGGRVAVYAPGQKEQQLVWNASTLGWEAKSHVFTNKFNGTATFYFHTGYGKNSSTGHFKNLELATKSDKLPKR